jgi:hypothetical protein
MAQFPPAVREEGRLLGVGEDARATFVYGIKAKIEIPDGLKDATDFEGSEDI